METPQYPESDRTVVFTDMNGIPRKGRYKAERHGYQETSDNELPAESEFVFPEDDIAKWEYAG